MRRVAGLSPNGQKPVLSVGPAPVYQGVRVRKNPLSCSPVQLIHLEGLDGSRHKEETGRKISFFLVFLIQIITATCIVQVFFSRLHVWQILRFLD